MPLFNLVECGMVWCQIKCGITPIIKMKKLMKNGAESRKKRAGKTAVKRKIEQFSYRSELSKKRVADAILFLRKPLNLGEILLAQHWHNPA